MKNVNKRIETIFSHAVALQQSGRLRNTIYCEEKKVFILNQDHTVLIRFSLRRGESPFDHPVAFNASDYDSNEFSDRDGGVEFIQRLKDGFVRTKKCSPLKYSSGQVGDIFRGFGKPSGDRVSIPSTIRELLDENLSHMEFSARDGQLKIIQRNIYSGSVIEVKRDNKVGLGLVSGGLEDFGPVGLRTNDFLALYSFVPSVAFWFGDEVTHFKSEDPLWKMNGVISQCVYDELGGEFDGRKK